MYNDENDGYEYEKDILIVWICDHCGDKKEEPEGYNEGDTCYCGGEYQESGISYEA